MKKSNMILRMLKGDKFKYFKWQIKAIKSLFKIVFVHISNVHAIIT
jgi:hypothetical protein